MSKVKQNSNGRGSLKDIQLLINEHPEIINTLLKTKISELKSEKIEWLSPLKSDDFAEYRDDDFIKLLDVESKLSKPLTDFWPKRGPQWDALGKCNDIVLLIEAKANIPEIASPGTKAKPESKKKIDASLMWTKKELGIIKEADWSSKYYQYANRLAHLCFLRSQNIPAYLVNVYFLNDGTVKKAAKSESEWLVAINKMKTHLGLENHIHSEYIIDLFIDVKDLKL